MAFLSTYIHDLFRLNYSEWTLFVGILILGIAVDRLSKPSYKKKFSYKVSKEHEREIFAKTLFSESVQVVTSQNLETVYANADFGRLTLDLCQAQFMTDRPQIVVQANFFSGYHSSAQGLASGYTRASYKPSRSERLR